MPNINTEVVKYNSYRNVTNGEFRREMLKELSPNNLKNDKNDFYSST